MAVGYSAHHLEGYVLKTESEKIPSRTYLAGKSMEVPPFSLAQKTPNDPRTHVDLTSGFVLCKRLTDY